MPRAIAVALSLAAAIATSACSDFGEAPEGGPDPGPPEPATVVLFASADNTIYEHPCGCLSNGAGSHLHIGRTLGTGPAALIRRALIRFDLSGIPAGSTIESCRLTMNCSIISTGDTATRPATLHRLTASWGEGASVGGGTGEGAGGLADAQDATWTHRMFGGPQWSVLGGDFAAASATTDIATPGPVTWETTPALVADAQVWVDDPSANHGWAILGDETQGSTGRRLDSRTNPTAVNRPSLTIVYTPPG